MVIRIAMSTVVKHGPRPLICTLAFIPSFIPMLTVARLGHIPTLSHIVLRTVTIEGVKNLPRLSRTMIENRRKAKAVDGNDIASYLVR